MFRARSLVVALLAALTGLLVALGREDQRSAALGKGPDTAGGRLERCVSCHVRPEEDPGGVHARAALGCSTCHLGNPLAFEKRRAHAGMEPEPGALRTVALTCGRVGCHPREAARVATSLMARGSGIIGVDRWAFGELPAPDSEETFPELLAAPSPSPARLHLRKLCAGCHLHTLRANRDDAIAGNGSGCSACHVARRPAGSLPRPHPPVDSRVTDDRCLGCHSRSGRIGLSYQGLAEVEKDQLAACPEPAALHDGRPACRAPADVHQVAGLACVDCHLHTDLMGDGARHLHKEDQVEITCEACHGPVTTGGEAVWASVRDPIARDLLRQRGETRPVDERVRLGRRGTPLHTLRPGPGRAWTLTRKGLGVPLAVKQTPDDTNHRLLGHERLTCSACHAAWAPTCSSCHVRADAGRTQWDFAAGAETRGAWTETSEGFGQAPPALGVRADGRIVPVVPGMVFDLDARAVGGPVASHRLFASLEPHTTGKKARSCASCHLSASALGLGSGTLELSSGQATFRPTAPAREAPTLAADAWTSLSAPAPGRGTRLGLRSLDRAELVRALAVGTCLPCHAAATDPVFRGFRESAARLSHERGRCRFTPPRWVGAAAAPR